ncbi:MAG: hypothetical protein JNK23_05265 [Opitutaceae bacterium]|nr:hypothetical protein [Opitutaceae bacterium]
MNSTRYRSALRAAARPASLRRPLPATSPALAWIHDGFRHRATIWPEVKFEREIAPGEWIEDEGSEAMLASAALGVGAAAWRTWLEFAPAEVRDFLHGFGHGRMAALQVIVRCPALLPDLAETPALTVFLATHRSLRGGGAAAWTEISAIHEREGIFGVLQWLGLPASRQTLAILRQVADPDLPRRLLEPLRAALWEPEAIWALSHAPALTDERIAAACHALAA